MESKPGRLVAVAHSEPMGARVRELRQGMGDNRADERHDPDAVAGVADVGGLPVLQDEKRSADAHERFSLGTLRRPVPVLSVMRAMRAMPAMRGGGCSSTV